MRKVQCVSPHGGCHHGRRADNGLPAPEGYKGRLDLEPHEGGYVDNALLGTVPVGAVVDAPEPPGFIADGFHFVDADTGLGDVCDGTACWCGRHKAPEATQAPRATHSPAPEPARPAPASTAAPAAVSVPSPPDTEKGM